MVNEIVGMVAGINDGVPSLVWLGNWESQMPKNRGTAYVGFTTRHTEESFWRSVVELAQKLPDGTTEQKLWMAACAVAEEARSLPFALA